MLFSRTSRVPRTLLQRRGLHFTSKASAKLSPSSLRRVSSKRRFSSNETPPPPPAGGNFGLYVIVSAGLAGAWYYFYDEVNEYLGYEKKEGDVAEKADEITKATKAAITETAEKAKEVVKKEKEALLAENKKSVPLDWDLVRKDIVDMLESDENYDDGSYGPLFVRLAWHSAGTYDKNTGKGGTEGAGMRFPHEGSWGANNGLALARDLLEPVYQKYADLTYSDLWSFAGTVAIEEMGGPEMKWRPGRKDCVDGANVLPDGLLPDADGREDPSKPEVHVRAIFNRMGFNDQEIVALLGAHGLGRCHTDRSGYKGPWTFAPTTLSNEFFRLLIEEKWTPKEWNGPLQYEDSTKQLMMLPTDMVFVTDEKFKKYTELYAKDEEKFMEDFAKAWMKLQENGVRAFHGWPKYIFWGERV